MNWKTFKPLWVEALRSGKYKQGEGALYNEYTKKFCCLGVGAIVCGLKLEDIVDRGALGIPMKGISKIPNEIRAGTSTSGKLIDMNDGLGQKRRTFKYIANWIEKNL